MKETLLNCFFFSNLSFILNQINTYFILQLFSILVSSAKMYDAHTVCQLIVKSFLSNVFKPHGGKKNFFLAIVLQFGAEMHRNEEIKTLF